jgi:RHS repeat-associated protein
MNKTVCLKSSLMFALAVTLLSVTPASGEMLPNAAATSAIEGAQAFVGAARTLLPDGRLLLSGGQDRTGRVRATLATRDPLTGTVTVLDAALSFSRAAHTATVLPDGTVLILGGVGQDGNLVSSAELFDPVSGAVRLLATPPPTARAFHTATLLTGGRVLVAGGVFAGAAPARTVDLWDPRGKNSTTQPSQVVLDRQNHTATLLPDGTVLFSGGKDENGNSLTNGQIFDPTSQTIAVVASPESVQESSSGLTEMRASSPQDGDQNVPIDALISFRFSRPVQMASVNAAAAILQGPDGIVSAKVVAAEGGMLAFIAPTSSFLSGTAYTVKLSGIVDAETQSVAYAEISFSTTGVAPASASFGEEEWSPTSDWRTHRPPSKYESLPDLEGPRGSSALAGQVLKLNGEPLQHVTLEVGNRRTESDGTGRFLLTNIPPGHQVLVIEGATANSPGKRYGRFEFGDEIKAGVTNKLDFKIWMSLLDIAHEITIPSPTAREMILTTPIMPGLELHLPVGTVITDASGKVVTKITITPIPVDRPPFPLPFVQIPIYFTIQPGGSYISVSGNGPKGARLFYPNNEHKPAGVPYAFWNYDADHNGWFVYGEGRVNKEGTQVVPDPGVVIYDFSGAMVGSGNAGPGTGGNGGGSGGGDPVDLSSGIFVYNKTDLVLSDVVPLSLARAYRPYDSWSRPFGIGASHNYEIFLGGDGTAFGTTPYIDLILADGSRIHFTGVPVYGQGYPTYLSSSSQTPWYGAMISRSPVNPNGYILPGWAQLQTKDGTIYSFPEASRLINPGCQALVGITDRYGNQVKIPRNADANCTIAQITSPNGRYIQFTYDTSYRVKVATDNLGRQVFYNYDASGRLQTVTDANNGLWIYGYDTQNRMTTIEDPRLVTYLTNAYDASGNLYRQYLADGTSFYQFSWTLTSNTTNSTFVVHTGGGGQPPPHQVTAFRACTTCNEGFPNLVSQVSLTDPRGYTRVVTFNQDGYATSDTRASGKPEQETTTYTYYADNLLQTATDQLGRVATLAYDVNGNPTSVMLTQLSGISGAVTTSATYDSVFSQPLTVADPLGNTTSINYDTYGSALSIIDPLGHQTTLVHNGMGLVTSITDAMQNTTQLAYDFADLIGVIDPLLNTTTLFHDAAGRLLQWTDPLGHTTKYQYNNLNQITQITDPLQGVTSVSYDGNGNRLTVKDARQQGTNNKTVYTYDNFDHVQTRTDPLLRQESYLFDQLGNLTSFTDRRGKLTTFQYDGINRRTFAGFGTLPGPTYESTVNYTYDSGNRLSRLVDSSSGTMTPVFDGLSRLTSETTPQGSVAYTYDNDSHLKTAQVTGQTIVNYHFDNASRLDQVIQGTSNTLIGYDNANRRSSLTLPNGVVLTYGYDNDSRINSMSYQLGTTAVGSLSYVYDAAGRRTQVGGSLAATGFPSAVSSAAYDVANELTGWNGTTIGYDANGNISNDGVASYTWNGRNQLISRGSTSFQYDSFGRRTLNAAGNNLLYEGWNVGQELSGTTPAANEILGGIDEFFSRKVSAGTYSPITDALGSVLALANSSGTIKTQYGYDPFGNTTTAGGTNTNVFQYTGRENDTNGLYFYRARYYNPVFGRFVSEDPIGFRGGINLYRYANDNPVEFRDPYGREIAGAIIDGINGAIFGGLGALSQGGDGWAVAEGAVIGGAIGVGVGALDPTAGVLTNGAAAAAGDLIGQAIANAQHGKCLLSSANYNWWEAGGAAVGGGLGAATEGGIDALETAAGGEAWAASHTGGSILSGILGMSGTSLGWVAGGGQQEASATQSAGRKGCS